MKTKKGLFAVCLALVAMFLIFSVALADSQGTMEQLDINQASAEDLCSLKGIDTVKASAIVEYREAHGPFTSIEDIKHVKGIGDQTFENIKDNISVTKAH
ncbi:MAG: helix-hairpin-helix domain-containing protein [Pseudomonadota bacterium]